MADEERKVTENADAEKKTAKKFAYQDVEAAVSKMMTPSVKKLLDRVGVDMTTTLPLIYQNDSRTNDETIEQYAQRCIESSLALRVQEAYLDAFNSKGADRKEQTVELEKQEEKPKAKEEGETEQEVPEDLDSPLRKFVNAMLGAPLKLVESAIEDKGVVVTAKGSTAKVSYLTREETKVLFAKMREAREALERQFEKDGVKVHDFVPEKENAPKVKKPTEGEIGEETKTPDDKDTVKLKNGKDLTFFDFKAALKQIAEGPETKKIIEELGINIDDVANEMFNKIEASAYEDALGCASASLQYVIGRKELLNAYNLKTPGFQKLKDDEERKGIQENKDGDPRNALFDNMKDILKFPFQAFKMILTGKSDEELKAEADKLNLKDVHLELTTLTRESLTKKLEKYESALANEVARIRAGKDKEKSEQTPAPEETTTATQTQGGPAVEEPKKAGAAEPPVIEGEPETTAVPATTQPGKTAEPVVAEPKNAGAAVPPVVENEGTVAPPTTEAPVVDETVVEEPKNAGAAVPPTIEGEPETTVAPESTTAPATTASKDDETLEPLPEKGVNAGRTLTEDTTNAGIGDPQAQALMDKMKYDRLTEEEKAKRDAEIAAEKARKAKEAEEAELDENDPLAKHSQGRVM